MGDIPTNTIEKGKITLSIRVKIASSIIIILCILSLLYLLGAPDPSGIQYLSNEQPHTQAKSAYINFIGSNPWISENQNSAPEAELNSIELTKELSDSETIYLPKTGPAKDYVFVQYDISAQINLNQVYENYFELIKLEPEATSNLLKFSESGEQVFILKTKANVFPYIFLLSETGNVYRGTIKNISDLPTEEIDLSQIDESQISIFYYTYLNAEVATKLIEGEKFENILTLLSAPTLPLKITVGDINADSLYPIRIERNEDYNKIQNEFLLVKVAIKSSITAPPAATISSSEINIELDQNNLDASSAKSNLDSTNLSGENSSIFKLLIIEFKNEAAQATKTEIASLSSMDLSYTHEASADAANAVETPISQTTEVPDQTAIPTDSPIETETPIQQATEIPSQIPTEIATEVPDQTAIPTDSPTETETPIQQATETIALVATETPTLTPSETATETPTPIPSSTNTIATTETPTETSTQTPTATSQCPNKDASSAEYNENLSICCNESFSPEACCTAGYGSLSDLNSCKTPTPTPTATPTTTANIALSLESSCTLSSTESSNNSNSCGDGEHDLIISNEETISGEVHIVDYTGEIPEDCDFKITSTIGKIQKIEGECEQGSGTCKFSITRNLSNKDTMQCGSITAQATACNTSKSSDTLFLSNYGITFDPNKQTINEGPLSNGPKIKVKSFPENLKISSLEVSTKTNANFVNFKKDYTVDTTTTSEGDSINGFQIKEAWWVGEKKSPPKRNLCFTDVNSYQLSANVAFNQCGLSIDTKDSNNYFKLGVKMRVPYGNVVAEIDENLLGDQISRIINDRKTILGCCSTISLPNGPFKFLKTSMTIKMEEEKDQYYPIALKEEKRHRDGYTGINNWSEGGFADVLSWENVHLTKRRFCSLSNCTMSHMAASNELMRAIIKVVKPIFSDMRDATSQLRCWIEYKTKQAIGWTSDIAAAHLECGYPNCTAFTFVPDKPIS